MTLSNSHCMNEAKLYLYTKPISIQVITFSTYIFLKPHLFLSRSVRYQKKDIPIIMEICILIS